MIWLRGGGGGGGGGGVQAYNFGAVGPQTENGRKIVVELQCATWTVVRPARKFDRGNFWQTSVVELQCVSNYSTLTMNMSLNSIRLAD